MADADCTCLNCGSEVERFISSGRPKKYCSRECLRQFHNRLRKPKDEWKRSRHSKCITCGTQINERATGSRRKYCSENCRHVASYKRRKDSGWSHSKKQSVFTCKTCGVLFLRLPGKGYGYCCDACRPVGERMNYRRDRTICGCVECGKPFVPSQPREQIKYCSPVCVERSRRGPECVCVECGAEFRPTRNSGGKYCSNRCNGIAVMRAVATARREAALKAIEGEFCAVEYKSCICCQVEIVGPKPSDTWAGQFCTWCRDILGNAISTHNGRIEFLRAKLWGKRCKVCGGIFTPWQESSEVCSLECGRKTEEYKIQKRIHKAKRRAQKKTNGPYHSIDPITVFQRDKWTCYLCGTHTPKQLRGTTDDDAPEMDHIVPLSKGGTHTLDNVACSCRKCNQIKSDKSVSTFTGEWRIITSLGNLSWGFSKTFSELRNGS